MHICTHFPTLPSVVAFRTFPAVWKLVVYHTWGVAHLMNNEKKISQSMRSFKVLIEKTKHEKWEWLLGSSAELNLSCEQTLASYIKTEIGSGVPDVSRMLNLHFSMTPVSTWLYFMYDIHKYCSCMQNIKMSFVWETGLTEPLPLQPSVVFLTQLQTGCVRFCILFWFYSTVHI